MSNNITKFVLNYSVNLNLCFPVLAGHRTEQLKKKPYIKKSKN